MPKPPAHLNYVLGYEHDPCQCSIYPWSKCNSQGYAQLLVNGTRVLVHRLSFFHHGGKVTPDKPYVLHRCDQPSCFNPHHLYAGTIKDNSLDMVTRGRNGKVAKVTPEQVLEIRKRSQTGETLAAIAKDVGISVSGVSRIKNGNRWTWVT